MSAAQTAYAEVTARLATLPNIIRARREDTARLDGSGATGEWDAKVQVAVDRVKQAVAELEKALA